MKVLLTGASGFVGRQLGIVLTRAGYSVNALMRRPDPTRLPYPCEVFAWNSEIEPVPAAALDGVTAVIHLAGESIASRRWSSQVKQRIWNSRIEGTRHLVESLKDRPIAVLVGASAIGYYGDCGAATLDENSSAGDDYLAQLSIAWERELFAANGPRVVAFRIGVVLDQGDGALAKMAPPFRDGYGAALGSGQQWMSWIHREDLVRMLVWALETAGATGAYNATSPAPQTNQTLSQLLAEHYGTWQLPKVPAPVLKLGLGEMSSFLLASTRVLPKRLMDAGFTWSYAELKAALQAALPRLRPFEQLRIFEQYIPRPREALFPFFEDTMNLEAITPPWLSFKVLGMDTPSLGAGTHIDYKLKLHGVPVRWRSLIESFEPPERFVDTQTKGPYQTWHHTHEFAPLGEGTLMRDVIRYRVPGSGLGHVAAGWKVHRDVDRIFAYRRERIAEAFPADGDAAGAGVPAPTE